MQINLLKKVAENAAGEQAVKIVDLLHEKKDVNEFLIAKKLGLTINQTRNILYKLSHLGLISSIRRKDKRKGWYIYFWTFNVLNSLGVLEQAINKEISILEAELMSKKTKRFYKCKICGREATEESALLTDFMCTECGEVYSLADNGQVISELLKQIEKLKKEREHINDEIGKEEEVKNKKLGRFLKREAKKKKELRAKNKKLKKAASAKIRKKSKKPSRKKAFSKKSRKKK